MFNCLKILFGGYTRWTGDVPASEQEGKRMQGVARNERGAESTVVSSIAGTASLSNTGAHQSSEAVASIDSIPANHFRSLQTELGSPRSLGSRDARPGAHQFGLGPLRQCSGALHNV